MRTKKVSVIIPYCNRLENIKYCLKSMTRQTLHVNDFEIIIGCLEYGTDLLQFIKTEVPELDIVIVMSREAWNVSRARNIAIKEAVGEVLVFIDADVIISETYLEYHFRTHNQSEIPLFIIGQTRDYDEGLDISTYKHQPFEYYSDKFLSKPLKETNLPSDIRWTIDIYIDWAMAWTFNLSVGRLFLIQNDLMFDENFKGWGVEDIEWGYRIKKSGAKVFFSENIWAIHLPHFRSVECNHTTEKINFRKFLCKWPDLEVEIVTSFGDIKGNIAYPEIMESIGRLTNLKFPDVCIAEFCDSEGKKALFFCGRASFNRGDLDTSILPDLLNNYTLKKMMPLFGFSTPYSDLSIDSVYVSPLFDLISPNLKKKIYEEMSRVCSSTTIMSAISKKSPVELSIK